MDDEFPRTAEAITAGWLSSVLGTAVADFELEFLEGGVLSDAFKLSRIRYEEPTPESPRSLVVKLAQAEKERRDTALAGNAYIKELNFFRHLQSRVPVRSPKLYGLFTDGSDNPEFFVIVMEDLSAHSKVFDQVDDMPDEAFTRKIALEAARMHAEFWESPVLDEPWISDHCGRYVFPMDSICRESPGNIDVFRAQWEGVFGQDLLRQVGHGTEEMTEILTGPSCDLIHERIYDILSERPRTLLHSDMRADNVFRTHPELGRSVGESEVTFIDWQLVCAGPPGPEFTQAWQHSLEPEVRRKDKQILRQYHDRLLSLNPRAESYTYDMLLEDYILSFLFWWSALIGIGLSVLPGFDKPEGARMKALWGRGLPLMLEAMAEHDCLTIVRRLADEQA